MQQLVRQLTVATLLAALAGLAVAAVALGQDREVVVIRDSLEPKRLEVPVGTVVTWRNRDDERHRVRSRQGPVEFDSGNLEPGERFSVTFVVAGEYPYLDERNDEDAAYFGTVIVIDDRPAGGPPPSEATVTLIDETFQPPALEVAVGATVRWENIDGDDDHTVTADDGGFNSGVMAAGTAFEHTFEAPGTFPYFCAIHPEMVGTITVVGEAPVRAGDGTAEAPETDDGAAEAPATDDGADPPVATSGPVDATIVDLAFEPSTIEIDAGSRVTWTNEDSLPHTVTARSDEFNSGVLQQGEAFSQTFDEPGTFDYFCAIHPSMSGTVVVSEPAAAGGPTADATEAAAAASASVAVVGVAYEPQDIEVAVGTTVEWSNVDPFAHTVTAIDGSFDSGTMDAGDTFSLGFDAPGTVEYFCAIHPSMTGTVTVTGP